MTNETKKAIHERAAEIAVWAEAILKETDPEKGYCSASYVSEKAELIGYYTNSIKRCLEEDDK